MDNGLEIMKADAPRGKFRFALFDSPFADSESQNLDEVDGWAVGLLQDLFVATEAIGHDQSVLTGLPHRWKQNPFTAFD